MLNQVANLKPGQQLKHYNIIKKHYNIFFKHFKQNKKQH